MAMKTRQETSDSDASLLGRSRDEEERPIETPGALGHFRTALIAMLIFTLALGVAAPLVMTGIARIAFPRQSQGSIISRNGQPVGSSLIGQALDPKLQPFYFQNRPSAIASSGTPAPYDAGNSGSSASNLSQTSKAQHDAVATNVAGVQSSFPDATTVPADLVEASGSGLDPHITPESARLQVNAIVRNRQQAGQQITADAVQKLVDANTDGRTFGIFGQPRVNVLKLNLALDAQFGKPQNG
ncbi:MAG: potassium-transporting ATPase subunit KdpC [Thermomicrobiales bacterium]